MDQISLQREVEEALREVPVMDVHTHLVGGKLGAQGLHDILLYHMSISDLYAAGCPAGKRLTEYPNWPTQEEAHQRLKQAVPYMKHIQNTSTFWGVKTILSDLYGWKEPITESSWERLDSIIRERSQDRTWHHSILDSLRIHRTGTEISRRGGGEDDERLQYALEWAFFTRCQWGEFDTALYELERCWGRSPESPSPIGSGGRAISERSIVTLADVHEAMKHYVSQIPYAQIVSTATHISTDIDLRTVSDREMEAALQRRTIAGPAERDIYASYINEALLTALEQQANPIVFQFSFGAEPLPFETSSRLSQRTIAQVADMVARHPNLRFQCFLSSRHANQSMCTLARELPNFSLCGYWWHNFFPDTIGQIIAERLDMLPLNKQIGFFSDAYCVEWTYGKLFIVRKVMSEVLAGKIRLGQYSMNEALQIAHVLMYETPQSLLGMVPRNVN